MSTAHDVVIPTIGRPSLVRLLATLAGPDGPRPRQVILADDRAAGSPPLDLSDLDSPWPIVVVRSGGPTGGRGPAAARNAGWRAGAAPWTVFLDDDVELPEGWARALEADLAAAGPLTGGVQARLSVPLPDGRRPTDAERGTKGLEGAAWATADMAYRRSALLAVGGFDERFPRAYREDADLALRVERAGWELVRAQRVTLHPTRAMHRWHSLKVQRGNGDDVLMRALHGASWRSDAQAPPGRLPWHLATVGAALLALAGVVTRRRALTIAGATGWAALTADFARRRIAPGPRTPEEVAVMGATSVAIPFAAVAHRLRGELVHRGAQPLVAQPSTAPPRPAPPGTGIAGVLFDRDGTLVHDVPYNGDPALVAPVEGAREAVAALRAAGMAVGVVTNQSGIGRGLITAEQAASVNAAVDAAIGPFDTWQVCPHSPEDACRCRKPEPGMVLAGAAALGLAPERVAVIGDIGADVDAAAAAGALGVLVPTPVTRPEEISAAEHVADDLAGAVARVLAARR